jgi:hypothetical protein
VKLKKAKSVRASLGNDEAFAVLAALWLETLGGQTPFVDDDGTLFRISIKKIAATAGISKRLAREELDLAAATMSAPTGVAQ